MSRRTQDSETGFGSDSFLDIIANIVGILIILIVLAGLRVSRQAVSVAAEEVDHTVTTVSEPELPDIPEPLPIGPVVADDPLDVVDEPPPVPELSKDLIHDRNRLEDELIRLAERIGQDENQLRNAEQQKQEIILSAANLRQSVDSLEDTLSGEKRAADQLAVSAREAGEVLISLRRELDEAREQSQPVETIRHKLTPVGKTVTEQEIHFRILRGRVAYVPVTELLNELKTEIRSRQSWLVKFRQHRGTVGPIDGFTLNYLVERQRMSVVEELRHGTGIIRIAVSKWEISESDRIVEEPLSVALSENSQFQTRVLRSPPGSALTFWVYPDSFPAFRELQKAAHAADITVAGRPLPEGVAIAGSPNGTRSSAQ